MFIVGRERGHSLPAVQTPPANSRASSAHSSAAGSIEQPCLMRFTLAFEWEAKLGSLISGFVKPSLPFLTGLCFLLEFAWGNACSRAQLLLLGNRAGQTNTWIAIARGTAEAEQNLSWDPILCPQLPSKRSSRSVDQLEGLQLATHLTAPFQPGVLRKQRRQATHRCQVLNTMNRSTAGMMVKPLSWHEGVPGYLFEE